MNVIKVFSISQSMASIRRYSQLHLVKPESVMEHTGFVCLFTYLLSEEINSVSGEKVDIGLALQRAVVHDIDEVVTGDIPRPTKYFSESSKNIFDEIAESGVDQIIDELDIWDLPDEAITKFRENWTEAKSGREGIVLALADLASVVFKIWDEVILLGNKKLILQGDQVFTYLEQFIGNAMSSKELSGDQKKVIKGICDQLKEVCNEVKQMKDPMLGTLKSLTNYHLEKGSKDV
jgi:5'-deoxynucleotidase YfbR-like HD superfamily hydrolase